MNGALVAMCDVSRSVAKAASSALLTKGHEVGAYRVDVSNSDELRAAVREVEKNLSPVDILANKAGILRRTAFRNIREEEWKQVSLVNVDGVFNCCKPVIEGMIEKKRGKILNILSSVGRSASTFGGAHCTT